MGIFIGIAPFWGFQTVIVLFLAVALKLNKALAFGSSNVSIPPMIPFIILGSLKIGALFVENPIVLVDFSDTNFEEIKTNITQYLIGSFTLATISALVIGAISYIVLLAFKRTK